MIDDSIALELLDLAVAIARMKPPSNSNPHAFHEDRSELASRARAIAARLRSGPVAKPPIGETSAPAMGIAPGHEVRHFGGRSVLVLRRRPSAGPSSWMR